MAERQGYTAKRSCLSFHPTLRFSGGWHAQSAAMGVVSRAWTQPRPSSLRACHPARNLVPKVIGQTVFFEPLLNHLARNAELLCEERGDARPSKIPILVQIDPFGFHLVNTFPRCQLKRSRRHQNEPCKGVRLVFQPTVFLIRNRVDKCFPLVDAVKWCFDFAGHP